MIGADEYLMKLSEKKKSEINKFLEIIQNNSIEKK